MKLITMPKIAKICCGSNNAGVPVISLSKRSVGRALIIVSTRKFPFHFKPVKKGSHCKNKNFSFNKRCVSFVKNINEYGKHNQRQRMTPNKPQHFHRCIQSTLQFINCSDLHAVQQFSLIKYRIPQIPLKIGKFSSEKPRFSRYI